MNLAILVGTISSEIRRIDLPQGGAVTKFRVKTVETLRLEGDVRERSQTHLIDVWSPYLQKEVTPYLREGQMIEIQGSIESRNIAKQGDPDRWTTTIVLRGNGSINIFGGPGSQVSTRADASDGEVNVDHRKRQPSSPSIEDDGLDEDVPF